MEKFNEAGFVNVGTGVDLTIAGLAALIKKRDRVFGEVQFDTSKPTEHPES